MSFSDMMNIGLMQGFAGLSLFAVLLLMGLGLAIIFGQMGVINMAHGEFMTIGAYTIYLGSTLTAQHAPELMPYYFPLVIVAAFLFARSEEHTSELQSQSNLVCRLLLEKKKKTDTSYVLDKV